MQIRLGCDLAELVPPSANGLLNILSVYEMQERLADIVSLAEDKQETAADFQLKHRAIEIAECASTAVVRDADLTRQIQKKRRERGNAYVLIVEDDVLTRGLVASCLKREHKVLQAKDAYSGIVAYVDNAPDMVFLDIDLPDMSGHELLSRLLALDPQAYVVMLTAHGEEEHVLLARKKGASGFLRKPFSKEKLLAYIKECPSMKLNSTARVLGWRTIEEGHKTQ